MELFVRSNVNNSLTNFTQNNLSTFELRDQTLWWYTGSNLRQTYTSLGCFMLNASSYRAPSTSTMRKVRYGFKLRCLSSLKPFSLFDESSTNYYKLIPLRIKLCSRLYILFTILHRYTYLDHQQVITYRYQAENWTENSQYRLVILNCTKI